MGSSRVGLLAAVLTLTAVPVLAHHAPYGQFSLEERIDFNGTVEAVEWSNPHAFVFVRADLDGTESRWKIELESLSLLGNKGWKGDELAPGTVVRIVNAAVNIAGDPSLICCARIYDLDGKEYFTNPRTN